MKAAWKSTASTSLPFTFEFFTIFKQHTYVTLSCVSHTLNTKIWHKTETLVDTCSLRTQLYIIVHKYAIHKAMPYYLLILVFHFCIVYLGKHAVVVYWWEHAICILVCYFISFDKYLTWNDNRSEAKKKKKKKKKKMHRNINRGLTLIT